MAHVRDTARRHGAIQARLCVHRDDTPAMRLRESHGDDYAEDRGRSSSCSVQSTPDWPTTRA